MSDFLTKIKDNEKLARFLVFKRWIRSDKTVKPEAFIPHPYPNLSVTRHIGLQMSNIWKIGKKVADKRSLPLYGRADFQVSVVKKQKLSIIPDPIIPENPNHANIGGWPNDKPDQKIKALEIAKTAKYIPTPR